MKKEILPVTRRLIIYKRALIEILQEYERFPQGRRLVCPMLRRIGLELGYIGLLENGYDIERLFPEFYNQKPLFKNADNVWWKKGPRGFRKRIKALKNAINKCKRQLKYIQYI